jgi:glucose/arabinose dehydrogenase
MALVVTPLYHFLIYSLREMEKPPMLRRFLSWLTNSKRPGCSCGRALSRPVTGPEMLEERSVPTALPAGFSDSVLVSDLVQPTSMDFAPDGRLFVAEKVGRLRVIDHGALQPTPFVTVPVDTHIERGLDGVVLDPNFAQNGFVYVYYTAAGPMPLNRLSRFTTDPQNPDVAAPGSEVILLDNIPSPTGRHNGGSMHFGADNMLYVGIGDGGRSGRAQRLGSLSGKVLRLDVDHSPNLIPATNPFVHRRGARPEIWALGFRNPFTSAIAPGSNRLWVNDVGEDKFEEIDVVHRGQNYGWPICEGPCNMPGFVDPLYAYHHFEKRDSDDDAITGGVFYTGAEFPRRFRNSYFFADFEKGFIRRLLPHQAREVGFARGASSPVDLDVGHDGRLYYASVEEGTVHVIQFMA